MSSLWSVRRSAVDAKVAGLCGGLARLWSVDPVLVRIGFVVLALSGGIGLVLYLAGWMLIPVDGKTQAPLHDVLGEQARRWPREVWIVLVAACCILTSALLSPLTPFGLSPVVVLALIWYFGYYRHRPATDDRSPGSLPAAPPDAAAAPTQFFSYPGPPTPFTEAAEAWRRRVEETQRAARSTAYSLAAPPAAPAEDLREPVGPAASLPPASPLGPESLPYHAFLAAPDPVGIYGDPGAPPAPVAPAALRRSATRSARRLRLVAVLAVGLCLSGLGAADALGERVPLAAYFAATLLILGLTLVAATWWGRARGILPVAVLLMLATIGSTMTGTAAAHQSWGLQEISYAVPAQLGTGDTQDVGQLRVDLRTLSMTTDTSYTAHVGIGDLDVVAPRNANLVINWRVRSGALILDGQQRKAGSDQSEQLKPAPVDPRKKTLTLNLSVDLGVVQVTR